MGKYDDIINMPRPVSEKHPRMSLHDRAAQFSPFAALTGYEDAVNETARLTVQRRELDEHAKEQLNERFVLICTAENPKPVAEVTYFKPDGNKEGGEYLTVSGRIKKLDDYERRLVLENGVSIPIDDIYDIDKVD